MPEYTPQEVMEAVNALTGEVKKYGSDAAQVKEMSDKVEAILAKQEEDNQKLTLKIMEEKKEAEQKAEDFKERMDALELELARGGGAKFENYKDMPEYKALNDLAKKGVAGIEMEQKALLRMDNSVAGGYLTTTEMDTEILKNIVEISPVRAVSRVKSVGKKTLEIPTRTSIPTATYEGEAAANDESASAYGNETLTCYRLTTTVPVTMDQLMDSNWDMMSQINQDISEAFAYGEGYNFVLGDGAKKPEGFVSKATLQAAAYTTATSGAIGWKDMTALTGQIKTGQKPIYGFNRQTLAYLRSLESTGGEPVWQPSLVPGAPNTINGELYAVMQDMPAIAANAYAVVYGDFMRGYTITDRTGMTMIRDDVTLANKAIVKFTFHRWNTGQVVQDEAFKLLKIKA